VTQAEQEQQGNTKRNIQCIGNTTAKSLGLHLYNFVDNKLLFLDELIVVGYAGEQC